MTSTSIQTTKIYNKNNNKLNIYNKIKTIHYINNNTNKNNNQNYIHFNFKNKTQINNQLTNYNH